jgi:hypothetical protein
MLGIIPKFLVSRRHGIHTGHGGYYCALNIREESW